MVWSPITERVDPIDSVSVNGIWMKGPEQRELLRWISRMMGEQEMSLSVPDFGRRAAHLVRETHELIALIQGQRLVRIDHQGVCAGPPERLGIWE